ncbi:unnamed protein product [Chondrus crispus]|uniref:Uncharacterized protein n=1 Tax=Chondrus crispus TaxID=2769 RepID=R7Q906_CHOCR|nr:unnamed protein product [Chondrus crispus]CDF33955.1 unnamed protein product [Chondrus crispus]|eukprot:XP_005713774.1 unnamed protein product [Chondrus crispus]
MEIESETAAINRELLYIPNATVFSLDDDHLRMAFSALVVLTHLRQLNNQKKSLGPLDNALCSALNPFFWLGTLQELERNCYIRGSGSYN